MQADDEIPVQHKAKRDERYQLIVGLVIEPNFLLDLVQQERSKMIANHARKIKSYVQVIYRTLNNYWMYGQEINALLPRYSNSGGRGKARVARGKKRGSPIQLSSHSLDAPIGVNTTESYKNIFVKAMKEYGLNGNKVRYSRVYDKMLKEYYAEEQITAELESREALLRSTEQTVDGQWIIEQPALRQLSQNEKASSLLVENDLVVTKSSGSTIHIGKTTLVTSEIAELQCCYSNFMQRIRLHCSFLPKLAWYIMNNLIAREQFNVASNSTIGLANLNSAMIGQLLLVVPTEPEQRTIAAFLDYETARIDQLIAKQRQLIELLKEKRQAVISHAVTKGLNPNAPMKDSGVEWLGQVPEHWGMTKVKHLCYVNDGNHGEEYPKENDYTTQELGVPFIRGGNMQRLSIVAEGMLYITKEKNDSMRKGRLEPEDILFMNRGEIGKLAKIPTSYAGANLNSQIAYLRCHKQKVVPDFMLFFLSSTNVQNMISSMKMGSVLTQFPIADIINISVPLPSQNEQQQIMHELSQNLEQFFGLEKKAEAAIYLMQERRTALISAAVTGKIDLRGWQPPKSEEVA